MNKKEIITRFAQLYDLSYNDAAALVDGENEEEIMNKITSYSIQKIREKKNMPRNRKQRRGLVKKFGKDQFEAIKDTSTKLSYIDLIQKLRKLNEQKEKEENDNAIENN